MVIRKASGKRILSTTAITCTQDTETTDHLKEKELLLFGLINSRSLANKASMMREHLVAHDLDLLVVTETWLTNANEDRVKAELLPCGYSMMHRMRQGKRGGGVAIIYKSNLSVKSVNNTSHPSSFELMEVVVAQNCVNFNLFVLYCPVVSTGLHDEVGDLLTQVATSKTKGLILGDFNVHWDDPNDSNANRLRSTIEEAACVQHVTWPTHVAGHTLDLIISRKQDEIVQSTWVSSLLSDHFASHGRLYLGKPPRQMKKVTSRCYKRINHAALGNELRASMQNLDVGADFEAYCTEFNERLIRVLDHHAPTETRVMTIRPNCQWVNDAVLETKREKRRSERRWVKSGLKADFDKYKEQRNTLTRLCQETRERYEEARIAACGSDARALFSLSKKLLKSDRPACPLSSEEMSAFFDTKISRIRDLLPASTLQPSAFDDQAEVHLRQFTLVTVEEVERVIRKSPTKQCDLDPWPTWLFKMHLPHLIQPVTHFINRSLSENIVPASFKEALICPTLKKPSMDVGDPQSYRPVSNLPFLTKVLERIVCKQLTDYLDRNELHHPYQSAYKTGHSVETALLKVQNDIAVALDQKNQVALVMLDLSAAFDTVDHAILLQRMATRFGFEQDVLKWISAYLTDWKQRVKIDTNVSSSVTMKCGVPQGSVLGPILFSLYISPLYDITIKHHVHTHQYADDCQLYVRLQSTEHETIADSKTKLEDCVATMSEWMAANKLKLNDGKSEVIVFTPPSVHNPLLRALTVGNTTIEASHCVKDLGVYFDWHLNAERQVNALCSTSYFHLSNIGAIRGCLSKSSAEKLMHAFVITKLDFCNSLLASAPQRLINKVQRLQNAAARIVNKTPKRNHITPVLRELHWLPIRERIDYKVALLTWQCLYGSAPKYLQELLSAYVPPRNLRSAGEQLLVTTIPRTALGRRAFSFVAPNVWNDLPLLLRSASSCDTFKRQLKTFLFERAFNDRC